MSIPQSELEQLVRKVRASKKYDQVCTALVERVGRRELQIRGSRKQAVKTTKRKLHQVAAAYYERSPNYEAWSKQLRNAAQRGTSDLRAACRQVMAAHASTRERLPILDTFYDTVLANMAPIKSVADLACGLNPLAIPWMPLAEDARYYACDIYLDMIGFLQNWLNLIGVRGEALTADVLGELPLPPVQVAFLLKSLPCMEQLDEPATHGLLERIPAERIVVSYPVQSLGGQDKGMSEQYAESFVARAAGQRWEIDRYEFDTELVFVVHKNIGPQSSIYQ